MAAIPKIILALLPLIPDIVKIFVSLLRVVKNSDCKEAKKRAGAAKEVILQEVEKR